MVTRLVAHMVMRGNIWQGLLKKRSRSPPIAKYTNISLKKLKSALHFQHIKGLSKNQKYLEKIINH